jgi:ABC-type transporter MlaC component
MTTSENTLENVEAIKLALSAKIKDMTPEERVEYFDNSTSEIIKKYGLKVVSYADVHRPEGCSV